MQKKSETREQVIAGQGQQLLLFLSVCHGTGDRQRPHHGGEDEDEIVLLLYRIFSRHELDELPLVGLEAASNLAPDGRACARNIGGKRSHRTADGGMFAMFNGEIFPDDLFPTVTPWSLLRPAGEHSADLANALVNRRSKEVVFALEVL